MSGCSMKPKWAEARQKQGASSCTVSRCELLTHGIDSVMIVSTKTRSCRARLCQTCQTMTGGASRSVRVRNTAVPGTRGMRASAIRATKMIDGLRLFLQPRKHRRGPEMPDVHDTIDERSQHQRHIAALRHLRQIRREEAGIHDDERAGNGARGGKAPAPDLAHRDEQERRSDQHRR